MLHEFFMKIFNWIRVARSSSSLIFSPLSSPFDSYSEFAIADDSQRCLFSTHYSYYISMLSSRILSGRLSRAIPPLQLARVGVTRVIALATDLEHLQLCARKFPSVFCSLTMWFAWNYFISIQHSFVHLLHSPVIYLILPLWQSIWKEERNLGDLKRVENDIFCTTRVKIFPIFQLERIFFIHH